VNILFVAIFLATSQPATAKLIPSEIQGRIAHEGAEKTLSSIYEAQSQWSQLLAGVATGRREWLAVAARLRKVSDAGASEQLDLAVGEALEHRPKNVLSIAIPVFGIKVCGAPDVDDSRYDSYALSLAAIKRRKELVADVTDPSFKRPRERCLSELDNAKHDIARFYGVPVP
jgi:hypothetical protein